MQTDHIMASYHTGQRSSFSRQLVSHNHVKKSVMFSDEKIIFFSSFITKLATEESTRVSLLPATFEGIQT